jgi:uncharacterized protein (TIGR02117 family)
MRKLRRRFLALVATLLVALLLGTLVPRPLLPPAKAASNTNRHILLLSNPIHTDIAIPVDAGVLARFGPLLKNGIRADLPDVGYLVFGWGGRAFYLETPTWSELKPGPVFSALTLDRSVMHVDLAGEIDEAHPAVSAFDIGEVEYSRLLDFISDSFQLGAHGPLRIPDAGYGDHDGFFEANGYFNALLGCNTWTAGALREAGLQTGWWNPLPQTLAVSLDLHN